MVRESLVGDGCATMVLRPRYQQDATPHVTCALRWALWHFMVKPHGDAETRAQGKRLIVLLVLWIVQLVFYFFVRTRHNRPCHPPTHQPLCQPILTNVFVDPLSLCRTRHVHLSPQRRRRPAPHADDVMAYRGRKP